MSCHGVPVDASVPGRRPGAIPVFADADRLWIGDVDVASARAALSEIGAEGTTSLHDLSPAGTIALLARLQDLSGAVAAVQARALVHLESAVKEDCRRRGETAEAAVKVARSETSQALKQSTSCAGQSISSCRRLVHSMPGMLAALAHGRIVPASAHRVGRTVSPATPEQRTRVDEILTAHLPYLEGCGPEEWAGEAAKVLHGLDPHGASDRHRAAKQERSVTVRRTEHGMCTVTARLSGLDGARIRNGLSIAAEKARAHGDRRGHQQIMADLFADALIGRGDGIDPSTLEIGVIITDRSLLAPDHSDAATIEGFGAVPYEHVREEMLDAVNRAGEDPELSMVLRKLYVDAEDGQLVGVESTARNFPPSLARFLRIAHQTCRAPYCDANIRQNDHIVPWAQGGKTSLDNGNGLCAADNQKEESGETARMIRDEKGRRRTVEWTSRYGQKASRRGTNFNPLGTGEKILERAAAAVAESRGSDAAAQASDSVARGSDAARPLTAPDPPGGHKMPLHEGVITSSTCGDLPPDSASTKDFLSDESKSPHHRALSLVEPLGTERQRIARELGAALPRRDYHFSPHLIMITDERWNDTATDAA